MTYDPNRVTHLGARRQALNAELDQVMKELPDAVTEALANGARQVDIIKATGYTREMVRRLGMTQEQREEIASRRRKPKAA